MKEKQFWNRILEFAQERLTRSMYDFYATPAELIKVEENTATIFLPRSEMEMVWEKQLKDIIVAAGFEIYDSEIKPHYIFTKPQSTESPQVNDTNSVSTYDYTPALPTIPYSETGLKEKYLAELDKLTRETEETGDEDIPWIEVRKQAVEKYDLWDDKLNEIYGVLKQQLSSTEMEAVKQEERQWIKDRDAAVKQVEIEEGPGTLAPYAMTMTKLDMTRDRCYELVNLYLK